MSAELAALVASLQYKPGWEFWLTAGTTMSYGRADLMFASSSLGQAATAGSSWAAAPGMPLFLHVTLRTPDSGDPGKIIPVTHTFAVPPEAAWVPGWEWDRWLFEDVITAVERHESMEFFQVNGHRPFYPEHGPGADSYRIKRRERA